jgi:hypothetical protein
MGIARKPRVSEARKKVGIYRFSGKIREKTDF